MCGYYMSLVNTKGAVIIGVGTIWSKYYTALNTNLIWVKKITKSLKK